MRGPDQLVAGDLQAPLVTLLNHHTGYGALRLVPMARRFSCTNQLPMMHRSVSKVYRHTGAVQITEDVFRLMATYTAELMELQQRLSEVSLKPEPALAEILADTPRESALRITESVRQAYLHETAPPRGTAYALLQAVLLADQKTLPRTPGQMRSWFGSDLTKSTLDYVQQRSV